MSDLNTMLGIGQQPQQQQVQQPSNGQVPQPVPQPAPHYPTQTMPLPQAPQPTMPIPLPQVPTQTMPVQQFAQQMQQVVQQQPVPQTPYPPLPPQQTFPPVAPVPPQQPAPMPMAPQTQFVQPAPNIQPPDSQPDIHPTDAKDMTVDAFPWTNVDGIGDKGVEKMKVYFAEKGITHMSQIIQGFDFKDLPGVGEKGAVGIRLEITKHSIFNPNPGLDLGPAPTQPIVVQPVVQPAPPVPNNLQPAPQPGLTQDQLMHDACTAILAGQIPDLTGLEHPNKLAVLQWRRDQGMPDYAPAQAPVTVTGTLLPAQAPAPVAQAPVVASEAMQQLASQAQELSLGYQQPPQLQQMAAQVAQVEPAPVVDEQVEVLSKITEVTVERYVSRSDYNNAAVRFSIQIDPGDDVVAITKAGLAYAEKIALGEA